MSIVKIQYFYNKEEKLYKRLKIREFFFIKKQKGWGYLMNLELLGTKKTAQKGGQEKKRFVY